MTPAAQDERRRRARRHVNVLAALLVLLALCAVFFVADVAKDFQAAGLAPHTAFEALVAFALFAGTALSARELRRVIEDMRRAEQAVSAASGALAEVIEAHFALWNLTAAEADVALLAIKGFDVAEIAELRGVAQGTVRAQLARIYEKAGVANRTGLLALFIEDLLDGPLRPPRPAAAAASADRG